MEKKNILNILKFYEDIGIDLKINQSPNETKTKLTNQVKSITEEKTDNSMLKIVLLLTKLKKTYLKKMRSNSRRTALNKLDIKKFKSTIT